MQLFFFIFCIFLYLSNSQKIDGWFSSLYAISDTSQLFFQYVQKNKESDNDWFRLESNKEGTRWFGKCWYIHELLKYEFEVEFDVSEPI